MKKSPRKWLSYLGRACLEFGLPGAIALAWGVFCRLRGYTTIDSVSSAFLIFVGANTALGQLLRIAKNKRDSDVQKETRVKLEAIDNKVDELIKRVAVDVQVPEVTDLRSSLSFQQLSAVHNAIGRTRKHFGHAQLSLSNGQHFSAVASAVLAFEMGLREVAKGFCLGEETSMSVLVSDIAKIFGNEILEKRLKELLETRSKLVDAWGMRHLSKSEAADLVEAFRSAVEFLGREIHRMLPKTRERPEREPLVMGF